MGSTAIMVLNQGTVGSGDRYQNRLYTNKKWHVKQERIQIAESIINKMSIRVNKLLSDTNIGLKTLQSILRALGNNAEDVNLNTKVPDEIAEIISKLCKNDFDFLALLEDSAQNEFKGEKKDPDFPLKILGKIDLDKLYGHTDKRSKQQNNVLPTTIHPTKSEYENAKNGFWIDELMMLSPIGKVKRIKVGEFESNCQSKDRLEVLNRECR